MQIKGNTFLVTGGSSGLGAGTAERLIELGGNVVIADVNEDAGNAKAKSLGSKAIFIQTDVTSETSVQAAIDLAINRFGGLQGAI
ncbi:MAG: SDR family NAD(P)-dependent oxidoreductase, partial [Bacteroidetes bacterium]|nr:SDR family NAD(P)-dependent oxidoreductase [Bacteroidota bacterium]